MSKKKKVVSLFLSILQIKAIKNIELDDKHKKFITGENPDDGDLIAGDFIYDNIKYSFIDGCSSILGVHRLSCNFTFEVRSDTSISAIEKHINNFNLYRIGIKASFISLEKETLKVQFSIDFISYSDGSFLSKDRIINSLNLLDSSAEYLWSSAKEIMKDK
ncbi:hypothetical protein [Kluyvera cryocrescens]|uniref:hypothetical protein n=1 Tax=Kluyvera cryocrescens TaxID=580 RepID=UPI002DBD15BD|nr:hypothetical protein [Kluyvera cryocrescens]MEB6635542.1 hypothetical protein [Kluyvera cryocrescens]